jgi:hypothetical protein
MVERYVTLIATPATVGISRVLGASVVFPPPALLRDDQRPEHPLVRAAHSARRAAQRHAGVCMWKS